MLDSVAFELASSAAVGLVVGFIGGMVGLLLGNLRLPLVYAIEETPAMGAGTNIGISTLAAAGAAWRHYREGYIHWRVFAIMGSTSVVGAFVGGFFARDVPTAALFFTFAVLVLWSGASLVYETRGIILAPRSKPAASDPPSAGAHNSAVQPAEAAAPVSIRPRWVLVELVIGLLIGVLAGMVGLVLGSIRLPALIKLLGMEPRSAVGTNMAVSLVTGIFGVAGHLAHNEIGWLVLGVMGPAAVAGSYLGARQTGRIQPHTLKFWIGVTLLAVSVAMFVQAVQRL